MSEHKKIVGACWLCQDEISDHQATITELQAEVDRLTASLQKAMTIIEHDGLAEPTEKNDE